jgi:hypothetical protein
MNKRKKQLSPNGEQATEAVYFKITASLSENIEKYCTANDITKTTFFIDATNEKFKREKFIKQLSSNLPPQNVERV